MIDALNVYFYGEKYAGLLLAGIGAAVIVAALLILRAGAGLRTFAVTLSIFALAEIAIGVGLYLRTDPQVDRLVAQLDSDAARFRADEHARMQRVQRNFVVVEWIELSVIIVSAIAAIAFKQRTALTGVALGLLVHAGVLLAFDILAERRGAVYLSTIEQGRLPSA